MNCGVDCRHGLDPKVLWLWCSLAAAAPILALTWEHQYATGAALKKKEKKTRPKSLTFILYVIIADRYCCLPTQPILTYSFFFFANTAIMIINFAFYILSVFVK